MHIHSFITPHLMNTSCLFKITIENSTFLQDIFVQKPTLLFTFLYKAWWWPSCAETYSWLLTDYYCTLNIVVLMVILLNKQNYPRHKTKAYVQKKMCMSAFVKKCIFIAQQWGDKQMCGKESRNCLTCSYRTIHSLTTTLVPSTIGTCHKHFPRDKAICMKMDVYFEI
jgi:hypothetical protein